VISKTVESDYVGATFRDATAGVLFWEDNAQALAMMATINDSSHSDTAWHSTATTVEIDGAAPAALRAGLDGQITLLQQSGEITYAPADGADSTLGVGAIRVASMGGGDPRSVYYVYPAGATLADGSAAAGRRVFFGLYDDTYQTLSPEGHALFDAAVDWASGK
jgi:hypothetical protein